MGKADSNTTIGISHLHIIFFTYKGCIVCKIIKNLWKVLLPLHMLVECQLKDWNPIHIFIKSDGTIQNVWVATIQVWYIGGKQVKINLPTESSALYANRINNY